jgi:hypothetical protein
MNKNILFALGTLTLLSAVPGATLLPDGQSDCAIYKQNWLRASVQKPKANPMLQISLNVVVPRHPRFAVIFPRPDQS